MPKLSRVTILNFKNCSCYSVGHVSQLCKRCRHPFLPETNRLKMFLKNINNSYQLNINRRKKTTTNTQKFKICRRKRNENIAFTDLIFQNLFLN